jgi:hypothetical protein
VGTKLAAAVLAIYEAVVQAGNACQVVPVDTAAWCGDSPVLFCGASKLTSLLVVANGIGDHALGAMTNDKCACTTTSAYRGVS